MTPLFILPSNYQLVVLGGGEYIQIDLEEPVRVASPTRINLEEPISSGYPAQPGLIRSSVCLSVCLSVRVKRIE